MVDSSDDYFSKKATIDFQGRKVGATLKATEGGQPAVELDQEVPQKSRPDNLHKEVSGKTVDGEEVILKQVNVIVGYDSGSGHNIRGVKSVQKIEIDGVGNDPFVDEKVEVKFDVLCFLPFHPITHTTSNFSVITRNEWEATSSYVSQVDERMEYIQSRRSRIRTSTITITQEDQNGPPRVQVDKALSRVVDILDISSFLLGVGCSPCRIEVEKSGERYMEIVNTHRNIGGSFVAENLVWYNVGDLVDLAYDWYSDENRNDYQIDKAIGYYLDSINVTRTIEGQLSTLFNGMELLAKRHSDYGPQYRSTAKRLKYLVNQLDVEVDDLAKNSEIFPDEYVDNSNGSDTKENMGMFVLRYLPPGSVFDIISKMVEKRLVKNEPIPEYFHSKARQYIVHGDNQSTFDEEYEILFSEFESTRILMQRVLRNRLFGDLDSSQYPRIGDLEPNKYQPFN